MKCFCHIYRNTFEMPIMHCLHRYLEFVFVFLKIVNMKHIFKYTIWKKVCGHTTVSSVCPC